MYVKTLSATLFLTLLATSFQMPREQVADTYKPDKGHSSISFKVRHLGIANVTGDFRDYDATIEFEESDLSTLQATAEIQTASIDTGLERRDNDLRSANFFDVSEYPTATFVSTRIENLDGNTFELVGDLTIKGVTREVSFETEFLGSAGSKVGFSASTEILRKDFGLTWDRVTEAGSIVVANKVRILLELELNRQ